ncbi:hypothetical protein GDO78_018627 [Eleutherodactylus coqui]|uniref:Polypeptide N-acetylgalactosaminyltransferase 1 n=1 Tax=Eleutherodactylus coqui TaxID=57060 RepID=A0A8J6B8Q6_ELECQ|nr:hypothetical protein GDO78_018627 [Eleutherodactylus coqui]
MKKAAYFKVVLATSLVWVFLDIFLLLYFSECNKCEDKERGLPAGEGIPPQTPVTARGIKGCAAAARPLFSHKDVRCVCSSAVLFKLR